MTGWRVGLAASGLLHGAAIVALIAVGIFGQAPSEPAIIAVELVLEETQAPNAAPNPAGAVPLDSTMADIEPPARAAPPLRPPATVTVTRIVKPDHAKPPPSLSRAPSRRRLAAASRGEAGEEPSHAMESSDIGKPDTASDLASDPEKDGAATGLGVLALVGMADSAKGIDRPGSSAATVLVDIPKPEYPWRARRDGLHGRVVVRVEIPAAGDGVKLGIVASSGADILDRAALAALAKWRFAPAMVEGAAVAGTIDVPIVFRLVD